MSHPTILPGRFRIWPGTWRDYRQLARFHYRPGDPRFTQAIWTIRYHAPGAPPRVVAVAVLSHPMRFATGRRRAIGLRGTMGDELRFINRHVRTISRVIVHPQFRALGLSSRLVRWVCKNCETRYVEALAQMGWAIPFFERAGMRRFDPPTPEAPVYYLHCTDRKNQLRSAVSRPSIKSHPERTREGSRSSKTRSSGVFRPRDSSRVRSE